MQGKPEQPVQELPALQVSLSDAQLPVRTVNVLETIGVFTVGDLIAKTREELLSIENFGEKTLAECIEMCKRLRVPIPKWRKPPRRRKRRRSSSRKRSSG